MSRGRVSINMLYKRLAFICLLACAVGTVAVAQEITLHGGTTVVLVPALVTDLNGEPIFGLKAQDFVIYDNGAEQKAHLDDSGRPPQTSVVVAVQRGHDEQETLDKVRRIGSLLYPLIGEGRGEAAVVGFDSQPALLQGFTSDSDLINAAFAKLSPGDHFSAVLDAVSYATLMLDGRPQENRKVLFLVSEPTDSGSTATVPQVIREVERSNVLVYSTTYKPSKSSKLGGAIADPESHPVNLFAVFSSIVKSAKENVPKTMAAMSGGEYLPFGNERQLEDQLSSVNNHFFNQYLLSFTPSKLSLGQHSVRVQVRGRPDVVVSARTGYWVSESPQKDVPSGQQ